VRKEKKGGRPTVPVGSLLYVEKAGKREGEEIDLYGGVSGV